MTTGDARNVRRRRRVRAALMVGTAMGLAAPLQAQDMVEDDAPGAAAPSVPAPTQEAPGGAMLVLTLGRVAQNLRVSPTRGMTSVFEKR